MEADDEFGNNSDAIRGNFDQKEGKKRSWTTDEDAYLVKLVQRYGAQKWTSIAEHLPGIIIFLIKGELVNNADRDGTII